MDAVPPLPAQPHQQRQQERQLESNATSGTAGRAGLRTGEIQRLGEKFDPQCDFDSWDLAADGAFSVTFLAN